MYFYSYKKIKIVPSIKQNVIWLRQKFLLITNFWVWQLLTLSVNINLLPPPILITNKFFSYSFQWEYTKLSNCSSIDDYFERLYFGWSREIRKHISIITVIWSLLVATVLLDVYVFIYSSSLSWYFILCCLFSEN